MRLPCLDCESGHFYDTDEVHFVKLSKDEDYGQYLNQRKPGYWERVMKCDMCGSITHRSEEKPVCQN